VSVVGFFKLPRDRSPTVQGWATLNLFLGQVDGNVVLHIVHGHQRIWGEQYVASRKPVAGLGDQIANGPMAIIEVEFVNPSYFTVEAIESVAVKCLSLVEHDVSAYSQILLTTTIHLA